MYALQTAKKELENAIKLPATAPKDARQADLSVPCFSAAKTDGQKQSPAELAKILVETELPPSFQRAEAVGPYANYFFSEAFFRRVLDETADDKYGRQDDSLCPSTYVLEYSQPNPGKPMHLGHIRSTIIGDVCANALDQLGQPVIRLNYLNDRGAHIAELITAMEEFKDLPKVTDEKSLLAYYVKIKAEIEKSADLKEKTRQVLEHLADRHASQLEKIRDLSWKAFSRNYDALGVHFDDVPLETALEKDALACVKECLEKKLAKKEPDGTIIADLEHFGLPNTVLLRSNGTPLYFTSDLALADWKWKKYDFCQSWIFTASEQNLHFKQLQLLLSKLGRRFALRYNHKGFGLIKLSEGKMSTRQGRVVLLEEVIKDVTDESKAQMQARNPDKTPDPQIAKSVGIGALKYGVLKVRLEKDILFDPKAEVQFEGDTSAYIQYAHVRACAILEKHAGQSNESTAKTIKRGADKQSKKIKEKSESAAITQTTMPPLPKKLDLNEPERLLLKKLAEFPEVLEYVGTTMQPHALCEYALSVAKAFTAFYAASPVLAADKELLKSQRLRITASTKNVLALALKTLGIVALEKM